MSTIDGTRLLALRSAILEQNSALQKAAGVGIGQGAGLDPAATKPAGFGDAMKSALAEVNELQSKSSAVAEAYERGETTDIAAVMLARQQASVGFEATLQVRNKLLAAYRDIMSMSV